LEVDWFMWNDENRRTLWNVEIDGLLEMMNYVMWTCNWFCDNDKVMNDNWISDWYVHDT